MINPPPTASHFITNSCHNLATCYDKNGREWLQVIFFNVFPAIISKFEFAVFFYQIIADKANYNTRKEAKKRSSLQGWYQKLQITLICFFFLSRFPLPKYYIAWKSHKFIFLLRRTAQNTESQINRCSRYYAIKCHFPWTYSCNIFSSPLTFFRPLFIS